jgi:hypothetical protein
MYYYFQNIFEFIFKLINFYFINFFILVIKQSGVKIKVQGFA